MSTPPDIQQIIDNGGRVFIRDYDPQKDEWLFTTDDPNSPEVRAVLLKTNPLRSKLHSMLTDIKAGRQHFRDGLNIRLAEAPAEKDSSELKIQIVDADDPDLTPQQRKVFHESEYLGDWTKDLQRTVQRYSDSAALNTAYDSLLNLDGKHDAWREKIVERAHQIARAQLEANGVSGDAFSDAQLSRFTATNLADALAGSEVHKEAGVMKTEQWRYDPRRTFWAQGSLPRSVLHAKVEELPVNKADDDTNALCSSLMNYSVQRAMLEHVQHQAVSQEAGDGVPLGVTDVVQQAELRLVQEGILIYGRPNANNEAFQRASKETAAQVGSQAIAGLMEFHGAKPADPKLDPVGNGPSFHAEVMADLLKRPGYSDSLPEDDRRRAYLMVSTERLERYGTQSREQVRQEAIKSLSNEMRKKLGKENEAAKEEPKPEEKVHDLGAGVRKAAEGAAKGLAETGKLMSGIETM